MVCCVLVSMISNRRRLRMEKKKSKQQHLKDPVLFCLDLLLRQGKDEEEALGYTAEVFRPDQIIQAKSKIMGLLGTTPVGDEDLGESIPEANTKEQNVQHLRDVLWAMKQAEGQRWDKLKYLAYSSATNDVHYFMTIA